MIKSTGPLAGLIDAAAEVVLGHRRVIQLALACVLARGHLLIEDLPGMGKTTLAHTLARLFGLHYARIQFTSDLLPADLLGVSIFDQVAQRFRFHTGPVFAQLVLADEINRATPKTQSALLEAMEEHCVTVDGETRPLPEPFFVIATQNPSDQIGTFPLPESQLDRFLMRLTMGYPDRAAERQLLQGTDRLALAKTLAPVLSPARLIEYQAQVAMIHVSEPLLAYCQDLLAHSRHSGTFLHGLSPRAGMALLRSARALAFLGGRDYVVPEDVQGVLPACFGHRLTANPATEVASRSYDPARRLLEAVPVP
ncbi:MAG: MoxR family ATPase [Pseudomonadota bacterium]